MNTKAHSCQYRLLMFVPLLAFFALGLLTMTYGHLHEDAYILFTYSENLSNTGVISYFEGGPPAEGATDFLWMILIASLNYLGINSGLSALIFNSIGCLILFYVIRTVCSENRGNPIIPVIICLYIVASPISIASYGGFSTLLFCSVISLINYILLYKKDRIFLFVAPISLILALIRPDGAVIAAGFVFVSIFLCPKNLRKENYFLSTIFAALCSVYFIWRWNYFGEFLPLPLIVKSSADEIFPSLTIHLAWLLANFSLFSVGILGLLVKPRDHLIRFLYTCLPIAVYFALTSLTIQSQNVGNRFQAPILVPILISATVAMSHFFQKNYRPGRRNENITMTFFILLTITPIFVDAARKLGSEVMYLTNSDYINFFPHQLDSILPDDSSIALTEAGRLAYWTKGEKHDLVGLNTSYTALNGASVEYISDVYPDIVMAHHAGLLDGFQCPSNLDFCSISSNEFSELVRSHSVLDRLSSENRVVRAAASVVAFLYESQSYEIYFVRYGTNFSHIYGIDRTGNIDQHGFEAALSTSFSEEGRAAYFDLIAQ